MQSSNPNKSGSKRNPEGPRKRNTDGAKKRKLSKAEQEEQRDLSKISDCITLDEDPPEAVPSTKKAKQDELQQLLLAPVSLVNVFQSYLNLNRWRAVLALENPVIHPKV